MDKEPKGRRVTFSVTMDEDLRGRLDAVVEAINTSGMGMEASRLGLVEAIVAGNTTLEELEQMWVRRKK